jgi:hypothetical protein
VLTEAVKPSPPSHRTTEAATMVVKVGGWWLAVGCWLIIVGSGERAVLMEWQMLRVAWFIAISVLVSVLFTSSSPPISPLRELAISSTQFLDNFSLKWRYIYGLCGTRTDFFIEGLNDVGMVVVTCRLC